MRKFDNISKMNIFSYGTVIQLCVPRNKRRQSSKRYMYKSVAKVTSRRARKGFNPDEHWSGAFYKRTEQIAVHR